MTIIMKKGFGRSSPEKIKNFFNYISNDAFDGANLDIEDTRNLLYVSSSRAIKNPRVLYLDDIFEIEDGVIKIFDKITPYHSLLKA